MSAMHEESCRNMTYPSLSDTARRLTVWRGYEIIRCGRGAESRPGNIKEKNMKKYVCKVCGYVYDPAEHDDVAFENLPDDWTCPVCGVGKDQFEEA